MDENSTLTFIRNVRFITKGHVGDFEKACKVSRGYLARAEQGQIKHMSVSIAMRMAEHLGYTVEELSQGGVIKQRQLADIDAKIADLKKQRAALMK